MADFSHLSDEELDAKLQAKGVNTSEPSFDHLSDDELDAKIAAKTGNKGFVGNALDTLDYLRRGAATAIAAPFSDKYSAGDVWDQLKHLHPENAHKAAPNGRQLLDMAGITGAEKPDMVLPTDPEELKKLDPAAVQRSYAWDGLKQGLSDVAGLGVDIATDPTSYIPVGALAKSGGKVAVESAKEAAGAAGRGALNLGGAVLEGGLNLAGKVADKGGEVLRGVKSEGLGGHYARSVGNAIGDIAERSKPILSPKLDKMVQTAESIGLKPEELSDAVKFGAESDVSRNSRVLAEMPGGEQARNLHNETAGKIRNALVDEADKVAGGRTAGITDSISAGQKLQGDFSDAQKSIRDSIDWDRKMVYAQNPGAAFDQKTYTAMQDGLQSKVKQAQRLAQDAVDPTHVQQANRAGEILNRTLGQVAANPSMEKNHEIIQQIGNIAFGAPSQKIAPDVKNLLRDTYFDLTKSYDGQAKKYLGATISNRIDEGNKLWSEWYKSGEDFAKTVASDADPEKVFKKLVQSGGSNELNKYAEFMKAHNPEGLENFKSLMLKDIMEQSKNKAGLSFTNLNQKLADPDVAGKLKIFFKPEEIERIKNISDLGAEHGDLIFNTSRTETARGIKDFRHSVGQRAELETANEFLKGRAQYPNGLPMEKVNAGQRALPGVTPAQQSPSEILEAFKRIKDKSTNAFTAAPSVKQEFPVKAGIKGMQEILDSYDKEKQRKYVSPNDAADMYQNSQ